MAFVGVCEQKVRAEMGRKHDAKTAQKGAKIRKSAQNQISA